jgi:hypothetical protein
VLEIKEQQMTISRRSFVSGVAPLLAFAAAGPLKSATTANPSNDLREDVFRPLIGTKFEIHDSARKRATVSLTDVTSLDAEKNRTRHSFTLRFEGAHLPQGTYRFKQGQREFELFVVPGRRSSKPALVATINRA